MAKKKINLVETVEISTEVQKMLLLSLDAIGVVVQEVVEAPIIVCFHNNRIHYEAWRMRVMINNSEYSMMYYLDNLSIVLELTNNKIPYRVVSSETILKNGIVVKRRGKIALRCKRPQTYFREI